MPSCFICWSVSGSKRMPVAIAPVDRQLRTVAIEFGLQRSNQLAILFVDRTLAAELVIVLGDGQHSFARNISATQHIFEEGNYLLVRLGTAERHHQQRVIVHTFRLCLDSSREDKFASGFDEAGMFSVGNNGEENFQSSNSPRE